MASQYPVTRLTTHEFLPVNFAAAVAMLPKGQWCGAGPLGQPIGAWESVAGQLNRLFILHDQVSMDGDSHATNEADIQPTRRFVHWLRAVKPTVLPAHTATLYELRFYTLFGGSLARYVELLLDALPARERYSPNVGIWTSQSGSVDQLVHLWAYKDADERTNLRPSINADPTWQRFVPQILPMIQSMQNCFLARIL
jgi:NIPSNAP